MMNHVISKKKQTLKNFKFKKVVKFLTSNTVWYQIAFHKLDKRKKYSNAC